MNKISKLLILVLSVMLVFFIYINWSNNTKDNKPIVVSGPQNATYKIDGKDVTLKNGAAITKISSSSASVTLTKYFGNEVQHDFDGDGRLDSVFLITQETGGSGTFYYVVAALNKESGYIGSSDAYLLGDRIAPQTTSVGTKVNPNMIVVNYADRKLTDSFAVPPSIGKTVQLLLDTKTMKFGIVANDFEGESR